LWQHIFYKVASVPSTVPEVEHEVAHELDVAVFDIDGRAQPAHIFGNVIAEDDASHRRLAGSTLAHQQHLALLLALYGIHHERAGAGRFVGSISARWSVLSLYVVLKMTYRKQRMEGVEL
jgi:hypothetical protein